MSRILQFIGVLLACLILLGVGYFGYLLVIANNQTRVAALTAIVSVGTLVYTQSLTSKREIAARQFSKKSEAYEEIMQTIAALTSATRRGEAVDEIELVDRLSGIVPKLMVWAGPEVLNSWKSMATPSSDPMAGMQAASALITSLRKELGHPDDSTLGPLGALSAMLKHDENGNIV